MKKMLSILLCCALICSMFTGCGETTPTENASKAPATTTDEPSNTDQPGKTDEPVTTEGKGNISNQSKDLTAQTSSVKVEGKEIDESFLNAYYNFAFDLTNRSYKAGDKNMMVSPYSVYLALGMLYVGAGENTEAEMKNLLGLSKEELGAYVAQLMKDDETNSILKTANSIWIREDRTKDVKDSFLQACANCYRSAVYSAPMNEQTKNDVNAWISDKTKGMIKDMLKELSPETAMLLVNALAFEAKWSEPFEKSQLDENGTFTSEDGTTKTVTMMSCETDGYYYSNEFVTGFSKFYETENGHSYSFVGLLPNEGVTVAEVLDSLNADSYRTLRQTAEGGTTYIRMPQFKSEYEVGLSAILEDMGMQDAFVPGTANFADMVEQNNVYVSNVLHKTFIEVDATGTKAAAATVIVVVDGCAPIEEEPHYVYLDRAFVYMIVDNDTGLPVFIGTQE